ncbi:MAG TPA: Arm DNA-binding domain-containing protein, partial [Mesorhizobium sp.]
MARALNKLTDTECRAATKPGMLGDGGGLYLDIKLSGAKSWAFIWKQDGKRREMGLGAYPAVKLAFARKLAGDCREAAALG